MLTILIQLGILLLIYLIMVRPLHEDKEGKIRLKFPLWIYLIFIISAFIPSFGFVTDIIAIVLIVFILLGIIDITAYYKLNKYFKFLNKKY